MLPCHRETSMIGFQLIPARGRKLISRWRYHRCIVISTYPRKGTETINICFDAHIPCISTYPRKGTETYSPLRKSPWCAFQLIPARGRKPSSFAGEEIDAFLFQLIPARGRKHKEDDSGFYFAELFQLIPARGRKPNQIVLSRQALAISTYPRKNPLRRCAPALPKGELL